MLNDPACEVTVAHPNPVVIVHGRGGRVDEGFDALVEALATEGYCVYGTNYGQVDGEGQYGVDHLWISAAQIEDFIGRVLATTGAEHVDVIGHSAGTGVLANYVLARGGDERVEHMVSFAGLQHPYAHAGAPGFLDNDLYLPNLIATARLVDPDLTAQEVITAAISLYAGAGGSLAGVDVETATSNFASDLFDPVYWAELHGGQSEPPAVYLKAATAGHTLRTHDAAATVCYTNIVGAADLLAGPSAGFQDPADNVDNFLVMTSSDHSQILADPIALERALDAIDRPCPFTATSVDPDGGDSPEPDGDAEPSSDGLVGCNAGGGAPGLVLALALLGLRRRRVAVPGA